jgi:hypothetical protein
MKFENTEWFKYFDRDEEGKPLSPTAWKVTTKEGVVFKSINWSKKYEDNETQQTNGSRKN